MTDPKYKAFTALDPFFDIVQFGQSCRRRSLFRYNRFISVVTIGNRKIVQWLDYMDSPTAMTALSQS